MKYAVYILYSKKLDRFYTGTTDDVGSRLAEHNHKEFKDAFSVKGAPWVIFLEINGLSSAQAYAVERHIKNMKSRTYIQNLKKYPGTVDALKLRYS